MRSALYIHVLLFMFHNLYALYHSPFKFCTFCINVPYSTAKPTPKVKRSIFLSRRQDHKNVYPVLTGYNHVDNVVNIKY